MPESGYATLRDYAIADIQKPNPGDRFIARPAVGNEQSDERLQSAGCERAKPPDLGLGEKLPMDC